jgi:hypothetical protein
MISHARETAKRWVVLVAVAFVIGLAAPSLTAGQPDKADKSSKGSATAVVSSLEIVNGLSQPATDESHASPFVPPGHAKHDGPDAPPGHAKHHVEGGPPGHTKDRYKGKGNSKH